MRQHKLFWGSSYDRGLNVLLKMWPEIIRKYPDAEFHIAYGWNLFDAALGNNAERMEWKRQMQELMKQKGIKEHGRISKSELKKLRQECGILAYCSDFTEIFCITAMECQREGCVPVTTDLAALGEFRKGRVIVKGDIYDNEVKAEYLQQLLSLMGDTKRWHILREEGQKFVKDFSWDTIAQKWNEVFKLSLVTPKVSIVTPTIRQGFWNIMSNNLANQTYKNFEWIIVDDYPEDRESVAKEYAEKYNLNIKYVRGKKRTHKRTYGLVNANNTGLQQATGELLVILQDFILIPDNGIEQLVDVYKKNPNALIAPTDEMYDAKIKPDVSSEDWFHGETDVIGEFVWRNIRNTKEGMRESQNPYEFEQNYCAIPMKIAKDLNGWYEFMDEGLGFDNTEFAYRALTKGYKLIVDDTNVCKGIDHWEPLKGKDVQIGIGRHRKLSDPRFLFEMQMVEQGKLPLTRDEKIEDKIDLLYDMPDSVDDKDVVKWLRANTEEITKGWLEKYE